VSYVNKIENRRQKGTTLMEFT